MNLQYWNLLKEIQTTTDHVKTCVIDSIQYINQGSFTMKNTALILHITDYAYKWLSTYCTVVAMS